MWGANSKLEAVQYGGGLTSVQWRDNMIIVGVHHSVQLGANNNTREAVQYGRGLASVQRRYNMIIVGVQH